MEEFLSGKAFEQMAREYNAKYNSANVLSNSNEQINNDVNQNFNFQTTDKEKEILDIENILEKISSLFLFTKTHIKRLGVNNFNKWGNFYYIKLEEIEKKIEELKQRLFENL